MIFRLLSPLSSCRVFSNDAPSLVKQHYLHPSESPNMSTSKMCRTTSPLRERDKMRAKKRPAGLARPAGLYQFNSVVCLGPIDDKSSVWERRAIEFARCSFETDFFTRHKDCSTILVIRRLEMYQAWIGKILRKEVIQPQVPLRLPCYDLVPIAEFIFGA